MSWRWRDTGLTAGALIGLVLMLAACHGGPHEAFVVDTTADTADAVPGDGVCDDGTGACSLRGAIQEANVAAGDVFVDITLPEGTYALGGAAGDDANLSGDLDIDGRVTISGDGAAVVDGQGSDRVFDVHAGSVLLLHGITVTGGSAPEGGGADVAGLLFAKKVTFSGNTATSDAGGGAVRTAGAGSLLLDVSTVSGNQVTGGATGGGLSVTGTGTSSLRYTTVTDNAGSGLHTGAGSVDLIASIVGDQASGSDCTGTSPSSGGYNIDSDGTCLAGTEPGDAAGAAVLLGPLTDNGGQTETHIPQVGSAALDRVPPGLRSCGSGADQREAVRPKTGACESGAVEVETAVPGSYTLYTTQQTSRIDLVDGDGDQVHHWETGTPVVYAPYLLPDGRVLRVNSAGGGFAIGGTLEILAWDGTVEWSYESDSFHHDVEPLPNGNILMVGARFLDPIWAVALGRDPATAVDGLAMIEILELDPTDGDGDPVVWEWFSGYHVVQDFDPARPNYADPADHPELLDINHVGVPNLADWDHVNGIDYNAEHDQIVVSLRSFNEIWVIDHSTTTAEAASHSGGDQGRGGDILYRWGNPEAYGRGGPVDRTLYRQHDPTWVPDGTGGYNVLLFDNGTDRPGGDYSSVDEIAVPVAADGSYPVLGPGESYGPAAAGWSWNATPAADFYQPFISGAQRLAGGNTLVIGGITGELFEVTAAGEEVWRFDAEPLVFKARRYVDFDGTEPVAVGNIP